MSSWGILLALSGYSYSGPAMSLEFAPKLYPDDFRTFWSTGSGWGGYSQKEEKGGVQKVGLTVAAGDLKLKEFRFRLTPALQAKKLVSLKAEAGGKPFKPVFKQEGSKISVTWAQPVVIKAGEKLAFEAEF
jgi:hypothetical protein